MVVIVAVVVVVVVVLFFLFFFPASFFVLSLSPFYTFHWHWFEKTPVRKKKKRMRRETSPISLVISDDLDSKRIFNDRRQQYSNGCLSFTLTSTKRTNADQRISNSSTDDGRWISNRSTVYDCRKWWINNAFFFFSFFFCFPYSFQLNKWILLDVTKVTRDLIIACTNSRSLFLS